MASLGGADVRTRAQALKALTTMIEADPDILASVSLVSIAYYFCVQSGFTLLLKHGLLSVVFFF